MSNQDIKLRRSPSGKSYKGSTPGFVLTIDDDGETVTPKAASGGGCVTSGAVITGSFACAENLNNTASGDFSFCVGSNSIASGNSAMAEGEGNTASGEGSHACGTGSVASGQFSYAQGFTTISSGIASVSTGFQTEALNDFSTAEGNGSRTREQGDHAYANGHFTGGGLEPGANQWRYNQYSGLTPGIAPGETTRVQIGSSTPTLADDGSYYVTVKAIATVDGVNPRESASYERRFILHCSHASVTSISAVTEGPDILFGATLAGSSLLAEASGVDNTWTLTFALAELTTAAVRVTAHIEFVEIVAFTGP